MKRSLIEPELNVTVNRVGMETNGQSRNEPWGAI